MKDQRLREIRVAIKGAGEMASGVAWRLWQARIRKIVLLEIPQPLAVRRKVSFCEAVYDGEMEVEGLKALRVAGMPDIYRTWEAGCIAVAVDPRWELLPALAPQVVIDAILAKRNIGTERSEAPLVLGLGPGFRAGGDCHMVIETNRGHSLGRVILAGGAEANTGIPGEIGGYARERVLRAPVAGVFTSARQIGEGVKAGETVGRVAGREVTAAIAGVIRGLIREGTEVEEGVKLGDIDPRAQAAHCAMISDKALAIAGGVLEAILRVYNK